MSIWAGPKPGQVYTRQGLVCMGQFPEGKWLAGLPTIPACGYVEPAGTPGWGKGYHCPRCNGALLRRSISTPSYIDLVEDWIEASQVRRRVVLMFWAGERHG